MSKRPKRWSTKKATDHIRKPILPYLFHKGSGQAYTRLPSFKPPTGKRITRPPIYLGKWGSAESHELLAVLQGEIAKLIHGPNVDIKKLKAEYFASREGKGNITVAAALEQYLEWAAKEEEPGLHHLRSAAKCLIHLYENVPAAAIGPGELEEVRREVMIPGGVWPRKKPWCVNYVNLQVARIRKMYVWLHDRGVIPQEIKLKIKILTPTKTLGARVTDPIPPIADEIVWKTLPLMPPVIQDMVRLQRLTGMRPGEVCALRPCDIDQKDDVWVYWLKRHKTAHHGKQRHVAIGPLAQVILQPYLEGRSAETFLFSPRESEARRRVQRGRGREGARKLGDRYFTVTYRGAVQQACDRAGLPHWAPNQLRKAAARAIDERLGPHAAQAALGHAKLSMTEEAYIQRDKLALAKQAAREIG